MRTLWFTAAIAGITAVCALGMTTEAQAGQWKQDTAGYWWQNDDGSYPTSSWHWLDGNGDGISECYYFDGNGYMAANTTTPDGYTVDGSGAWVVDGVVQTQGTQTQGTQSQGGGTSSSWSGNLIEPQEDVDSFIIEDKVVWTTLEEDGSGQIVMENLDGSGRETLLEVDEPSDMQVAYKGAVYIQAGQEEDGEMHEVIYCIRPDGSVETVYDTTDRVLLLGRSGNKMICMLSKGNVSTYKYFTPNDYDLRSYGQDAPFIGGVVTDGFGSANDLGFFTEDNYSVNGGQIEIRNNQGTTIGLLTLSGTTGPITPLFGSEYFIIFETGGNYYRMSINGGWAVEIENPGDLYAYQGKLYSVGSGLYLWDAQGNATLLYDPDSLMDGYGFVNGYFLCHDRYEMDRIKL